MTVHRSQFLPSLPRSAGHVFAPIQREFDRLFDQLGTSWGALTDFELAPSMDVRDTQDGLEITMELPGLSRDDVKIAVEDNLLTVSGEKKSERETKAQDYRVSERAYGAFSRSVALPHGIDASKIAATLRDGVLTLTAPRNPAAKSKTVEIKPAA